MKGGLQIRNLREIASKNLKKDYAIACYKIRYNKFKYSLEEERNLSKDELEKYLMDVLDSKEQVGYSQFGLSTALERLQKYRTRKNKCSYIYKYLNQRSVEGTGSGLLNLKTRKILEI